MEFTKQWCDLLKANYALAEKREATSKDIGFRLPVLLEAQDPFYPVGCFRQWWLTEAGLSFSNQLDARAEPPLRHLRSFSEYPKFSEYSKRYFAYKDTNGNLQFPENYNIKKNIPAMIRNS